jgi:acyl dehydratase
VAPAVRFEDVHEGDEIPARSKVIRRADVNAYADASGDQNPLHQEDAFAVGVGFPGIIAHGMFSMAHLASALTDWLGDPAALVRLKVQFRAPVFMEETLIAAGRIVSLEPETRRARLEVTAFVDRDGSRVFAIKNSEAEVQLA